MGGAAAEAVTAAVKELEQVASAYAASAPESVSKSSAEPEKAIVEASAAAGLESPAPSQADLSQAVKQEIAPAPESVSSEEAAPRAAGPSEAASSTSTI